MHVPDSQDPQINRFRTLGELCGSYPEGLGFRCVNNEINQIRPFTTDFQRAYGNEMGAVCIAHCRCVDIAPNEPGNQEAINAQMQDCALSDDEVEGSSSGRGSDPSPSSSSSCPSTDETTAGRYRMAVNCDSYWYGHPTSADCRQALRQLPDAQLNRPQIRQFLGWDVRLFGGGTDGVPVRTPIMATHGTCSIAVIIPEGPRSVNNILVDTLELNTAARKLRDKCVVELGMGGSFHQGDAWREEDVHELPEILMFGPGSKWEDFLAMKYACLTDSKGAAKCKPLDLLQPTKKKSKSVPETHNGGTVPVPKGNKQACSGSCLDPSDCDINSGCVCASDKGFPLSSSWSQHACTYITGAAGMMAAAAISPNKCRGRCLLEEDGTLNIDSLTNGSDATASYDASNIFANLTDALVANLTGNILGNSSSLLSPSNETNSPVPFNASGLALGDFPLPSSGNDSFGNLSSVVDSVTNDTAPIVLPEQAILNDLDQPAPILNCPCNCTYVSAACCLSRFVWEDPSMQIKMDPLPANSSVCCDSNTGRWEPKSSGCGSSASNDSTGGFIGLGNVKWKPNAFAPKPTGTGA